MAEQEHNIVWIHDPPFLTFQEELGIGGVFLTHGIGGDPNDHSGFDHSAVLLPGLAHVDRANYGYDRMGTIPPRHLWENGIARLANWAIATPALKVLQLGNEPNMAWERPGYGGDGEEKITPTGYGDYWKLAWDAMRQVRPDVLMAPAPVAPWNTETWYDGNLSGDWVRYWQDLLHEIEDYRPGAIVLHAYTHGTDRALVLDDTTMDAPWQAYYYHWQHVRQLWDAMPSWAKALPAYIGETNQDGPWSEDPDNGWCTEVAFEVERMRQEGMDVRCFAAYCWPDRGDGRGLVHNPGAREDLRRAAALGIMAGGNIPDEPPEEPPPGGGEMNEIYRTSFNEGFYRWNDEGEMTCPRDAFPAWAHTTEPGVLHRPEYKPKDTTIGQPEVLTPPYAAGFFWIHSTGDGALVFEVPVAIGAAVEAEVQCMGVGVGGMAIGISVEPVVAGPHEPDYLDNLEVNWGEWWSSDVPDWNEREWRKVISVQRFATHDRVWVLLRGKARDAMPFFGAHWDDLVVLADEEPIPPDPGDGGDLAAKIRASAAALRQEATKLDDCADVAAGDGVARSPVAAARNLLNMALGDG